MTTAGAVLCERRAWCNKNLEICLARGASVYCAVHGTATLTMVAMGLAGIQGAVLSMGLFGSYVKVLVSL